MFKGEDNTATSPLQSTPTNGKGKLSNGSISAANANSKSSPPPSSLFTTTFYLAYPPPQKPSPLHRMKPRLLVQLLQQAVRKKRLQPVFEVLRTVPLGSRYWQNDVRCRSGDIVLVCGDFYSDCTLPDGSRAEYSEDERDEEKTKVIAVIQGQRKIHTRQHRQGQITADDSGPTRFFFSCGAIWEAITMQNGDHYQLVAVDSEESRVNGDYKLISWTREYHRDGSRGNETQADVKFRLRVVDRNFRDFPLVATATKQSIEVMYQPLNHDGLASLSLQPAGRKRARSFGKRDNPFASLDTSFSEPLYLLCLVLTSAIWVASNEGWLSL